MDGHVWETGEVLVVENYQEYPERYNVPDTTWVRAAMVLPLKRGTEVVGVMGLLYADTYR